MKINFLGKSLLAALTVLTLAGCNTVEVTDRFNGLNVAVTPAEPVKHIYSSIQGVYILGCIPFISGTPNGRVTFFSDSVTFSNAYQQMMVWSKGEGADAVIDVTSDNGSAMMFPMFFMTIKKVECSGTAVKLKR